MYRCVKEIFPRSFANFVTPRRGRGDISLRRGLHTLGARRSAGSLAASAITLLLVLRPPRTNELETFMINVSNRGCPSTRAILSGKPCGTVARGREAADARKASPLPVPSAFGKGRSLKAPSLLFCLATDDVSIRGCQPSIPIQKFNCEIRIDSQKDFLRSGSISAS